MLQNLAASAHYVYLVHPPILVALSMGIAVLDLGPVAKIGIVFPLAVLTCYLVSHYITG